MYMDAFSKDMLDMGGCLSAAKATAATAAAQEQDPDQAVAVVAAASVIKAIRRHIRRSTAESESGRDSCCCRNRRIHSHNYSRSFLRCYHIRNRSW